MSDASNVSLGGETVKGTSAKFLMALAGFIGTIVFARKLGPADFGAYYLLFSIVKIVDRPINGVATASKKRFSEAASNKEEIFGVQILVIIVWVVIVSAVVVAASSYLRRYAELEGAAWLFVVLLLTVAVYEPLELLVQARGRIGIASWIDAVRSYLTLPLQVWLVVAGLGAAGMAYGLAVATALVVPFISYYVGVLPSVPSKKTVLSITSFARHSVITSLIGKAYDRMDLILLGVLVGAGSAGQYEVAAKLSLPATFVSLAAGSGLMARVSNSQSKDTGITSDITNTLSFASIIAIPFFFGSLALSNQLVVTLYGPEYQAAAPLLVGLCLYRVLQTQAGPLTQVIDGINRPDLNWRISLLTVIINVIVGVALVQSVGPVGVVAATILAEGVRYSLLYRTLRKEFEEIRLLPRTLLEQLSVGAVMFVVITGLHNYVRISSWIPLSLLVGAGAVVYAALLFVVSEQLRITIRGILSGTRAERYLQQPPL